EISFCAYNTGIGWRKIIENMYKNATVAEWYRTHGKHEIYAKGKAVPLSDVLHSLRLREEDVHRKREIAHDIPQTAAEEERLRRKLEWQARQAREVYEEMVLKKPKPALIQIGNNAAKPADPVVPGPAAPAESVGAAAHGDD
ncbi:MAG: radical SAM protein, partial [Acidobacteria bacterium]|nr:radical SAM protein [Acidobacteriota bacterium]